MTFRPGSNRDLRSIARVLRVANVVEGTVRKDGSRTRISVRLVDARTDLTIWSETYDRDLTDIFTIQSEVAQMIARKLMATISPAEKERIEAKLTDNLEAYDLYLRAKQLITYADINALFGHYERHLIDAIALLEHAIRLDPKFTLAYCASAKANASLCFRYGSTLARRAFGDEAVKQALYLQPELPEAHLAYAYHLYGVYSDYEQARVQLAIARRGLPNDVNLIRATAWMDRRQGHWEKAIRGFKEAISLDPRNVAPLVDLEAVLGDLRRFTACEQAYDRAIDLALDQPLLKAQRALWLTLKTGDITALSSVIAALPRSTAEDPGIQSWRLSCALVNRDWQQATELIEQMKGSEDLNFSYTTGPVPVDCYFILLSRFQGEQPGENPAFAEIRKKLNQRVQASPGNARLLSNLAVADALLGRKHKAIPAGPERNKSDFAIKNTGEQQGPMVLCNYGSPHFGPLQNGKRSKKLGRDYSFISSLPSAHMNYRDCLGIFDRRQTKHICVKIWKEIPPRRNTSQRLGRPPAIVWSQPAFRGKAGVLKFGF